MQDFFDAPVQRKKGQKSHYHGNTVRKLFLSAGILILVSLPLFPDLLPISPLVTITAVVILAIAAAITSYIQMWAMVVNSILSAVFLIAFEAYALAYKDPGVLHFLIRQIIALIFLFALYYSVRTVRAMYLHQIHD